QRTTGQQSPSYRPNPQADIGPRQDSGPSGLPGPFSDLQPGDRDRQNERALVLVRAMVNAAKSDGQISQAEQQSILEHIDSRSPETIQFLRSEFAKPLDVREFAWSVPKGMEQEVYTMSLIAIDLDTDREARYLTELAHGLRLSDDVRDKIHQRLGAPPLL
ncbi:MAG: tellurite resistance TerB family protein, partial [Planctomycetes bacterium]|nr:tellurite resistance TerB family protein [Planctomycetota bacterium]